MDNSGKGGRPSYASREKQMAAYDQLPASVRKTLAEGYENWATYSLWLDWKRGKYASEQTLCAIIRIWNRSEAKADRDELLAYVNQHAPKAACTRRRSMRTPR